ncbi:MAG: phage terminase small subunit-related protein [Pseudomonadota bacterium]
MRKNEDRKLAEETFLRDRGRVTNKDLARVLGVHPATVARWKKLDEWDMKLVQSISDAEGPTEADDLYHVDLKHLGQLNERIDAYLEKRELLPSEILELAQAKFHIMHCMEIINDQLRYPLNQDFDEEQHDFD